MQRPEALAAVCDQLLQQFDGSEVSAAEIRFFVHKRQHDTYPRIDPRSAADLPAGELAFELRQLIAWAGGALADVADTLETRGGDLDQRGRELLQDEVAALGSDLGVLKAHLSDSPDWNAELERLLSGEVPPFARDETDEDDD